MIYVVDNGMEYSDHCIRFVDVPDVVDHVHRDLVVSVLELQLSGYPKVTLVAKALDLRMRPMSLRVLLDDIYNKLHIYQPVNDEALGQCEMLYAYCNWDRPKWGAN